MSELRDRILRLSPAQRQALADRMGAARSESAVRTLVAVIKPNADKFVNSDQIRAFLAAKLPEHMVPRLFTVVDEFPLTASGKLDRKALAQGLVRSDPALPRKSAQSMPEQDLLKIWVEVLQTRDIGTDDNFFELGGDSILAIQVVARSLQQGYRITPRQLFQYPTIAELAGLIGAQGPGAAADNRWNDSGQDIVEGEIPLTPIQSRFFERNLPEKNHFNQALSFDVSAQLDGEILGQALKSLMMHHDALRLRFFSTDRGWVQVNGGADNLDADKLPVETHDLSGMAAAEQQRALANETDRLQRSLDITSGPLLLMAYFDLGSEQPGRLLIVIHHLAVDGVSWRILVDDFQAAYRQLAHGEAVRLPAKTASYKQWAKQVKALIDSGELDREAAYWTGLPYGQAADLPVDFSREDNVEADVAAVSTSLDAATTAALLQDVPATYNTRIDEILLAALSLAFYRWEQLAAVLIEPEYHGREIGAIDLDTSRTVGWFTTAYPVLLQNDHPDSLAETIKSTKENLRQIPAKGIGYWLLRHGNSDAGVKKQLAQLPQPQVSFNYLGQFDPQSAADAFLRISRQEPAQACSPAAPRPYLLEINSYILEKQLRIAWRYNCRIHQPSTIEALGGHFEDALREIVTHCTTPGSGGYTPSDFPRAQLDQDELDDLLDELN